MPQWLEVAWRTLVAVGVLFVMTKLLGKRQITQLSLFEYITGITIGNLSAYIPLDLESKWYLGLVSLGVWVVCALAIEFLQMKSKKARDLLDGKGTILIKGGKILEDNLKKERLTTDELLETLRTKNVFRMADVEFAIMEPNGSVNVLLTRENQPLTAKHLGIKVGPEYEPQAVIMDGKIMDEPLATIGKSRAWLNTELAKAGVAVENVFLAQVDSYGQINFDFYDDQLKAPEPQSKAVLYANLKKCEADLELFALSVRDGDTKKMFEDCSDQMLQVLKDVKPLLHN